MKTVARHAAVLAALAPACAQVLIEESRIPPEFRDMRVRAEEKRLECSVRPINPAVNFSFRIQAGYGYSVPVRQYAGSGHGWGILTRVTPDGGKPVYLFSSSRLPRDIPENAKGNLEGGGGFLLGEGRYSVEWMLGDSSGRLCAKKWRIEASYGRREKAMKPALPPNTVTSLAPRFGAERGDDGEDTRRLRLTVLAHVAPLFPRRTRLSGFDRMVLISTIASLVEQIPRRSLKLVAFNLDQQRELLREESFSHSTFVRVAEMLNTLDLGTIDYKTLQNRHGHANLLAELVNRELRAKERPDAVIFLGPASRYLEKFPESALEPERAGAPAFFFFQSRAFVRSGSGDFPDLIASATKTMRGKVLTIYTPGDFAKAIRTLKASW